MKKLLLAPFLLGSLFSFGGELKAHPENSNSRPTPTAAVNRWFLFSYAFREEKNVTMKVENSVGTKHTHPLNLGSWGFGESVPVPSSFVAFTSQA